MEPPKIIYLIPDYEGFVWCEDPAPRLGMERKDAIKYVRADTIEEDSCETCEHEYQYLMGA